MVSPWQIPLPLEEHTTSRVVVYFYSNKLGVWIPIVFFPLVEALALHRKGLLNGAEFFVFPPDLDPCNWGTGDWVLGRESYSVAFPNRQPRAWAHSLLTN